MRNVICEEHVSIVVAVLCIDIVSNTNARIFYIKHYFLSICMRTDIFNLSILQYLSIQYQGILLERGCAMTSSVFGTSESSSSGSSLQQYTTPPVQAVTDPKKWGGNN